MPHRWEGTPGRPEGEHSQRRISQPELLPQVGREAGSASLQLCSAVSWPAGKAAVAAPGWPGGSPGRRQPGRAAPGAP